jgi:hypothetical protein
MSVFSRHIFRLKTQEVQLIIEKIQLQIQNHLIKYTFAQIINLYYESYTKITNVNQYCKQC